MTLIINQSDLDNLYEQAPITCPDNLIMDEFETLEGVPEIFGQGYDLEMNLLPGVWLRFTDWKIHHNFIMKVPVHDHPIQITIWPSGTIYFDAVHPKLGNGRSYFSGSGLSPAYTEIKRAGTHYACVDIEIEPHVFTSMFLLEQQRNSEVLKSLLKGEDWKVAFYPMVTPAIHLIAQQMWSAPYRGELKQLYLQAKIMELLVVYLDLISDNSTQTHMAGLRPDTIDRLHHAKTILDTRLDNPPSMLELSQQVGVSDRTLLRGFKQLFGTTVVGYSMQQRLKYAECLLRQGNRTVAEVARLAGYGQLKYFSAIFKRQFGITPSECLAGKKSVL